MGLLCGTKLVSCMLSRRYAHASIGCDFRRSPLPHNNSAVRVINIIIQHSQLKKSSVAGVSRSSKKRIHHGMPRWFADSDSISINKSAGHWS